MRYTLVCLSVRQSRAILFFKSKTENHTTFKLRGKVMHVSSTWQSKFEGGPHIAPVWATLSSFIAF